MRGAVAAAAWVAHQLQSAPIPTSFDNHEHEAHLKIAYCDAFDESAQPAREQIASWQAHCDSLE